jgi:serine protease
MNQVPTRRLLAALVAGVFGMLAAAPATAQHASRVIVAFKAGQGEAARAAIAQAGGRVVTDLSRINALAVRLPANAIARLKRHSAVELVEDDPLRYPMGSASAGEVVPYGIPMVQADQVPFNVAGAKKICVIDSGYSLGHEDLQAGNVTGENLTTEADWNVDLGFHGTHVTGTIAALGGNGVGVVGVVPTGTNPLHIMKVFDASGSAASSVIMEGVIRCNDAGAKIINMSLGGGLPSFTEWKLYRDLSRNDVLVVAAAGNGGNARKSYPASYAGVMSVAAVDAAEARAEFSQYNNKVEIAAPGVDTLSTIPMGQGGEYVISSGGIDYNAIPMTDTPVGVVTGAMYDLGLGQAVDAGAAGKVCLIQRGGNSFAEKVLVCQDSGGIGAVIYNNTVGLLNGTLGGEVTTIPSVGITQADGQTLLGQIPQDVTVDTANFVVTNYAYFNGTSMATPHVTGVAALVWSNFPTCTAAQIRSSLTKHAKDLGPAGKDNEYGYGLVQAKATYDGILANGCGN